jgi:uncharacterized protein
VNGESTAAGAAPKTFQILSLDGGGLKGLFAAAVLAELEADLGVRIVDHFDLIAGTSTGGLVALALGAGYTPAEVVEFYVERGPEIFSRPRTLIGHCWRPKHKAARLRSALEAFFGDRRLGDSTVRLLIPSYSLERDDVYIFKTPHSRELARDWRETMVDVGLATSAAPTYFSPARLRNHRLIDGGVWANNPSILAVAEAVGVLGVALADIRLLSLGTSDELTDLNRRLDGGLLAWARSGRSLLINAPATGSFHTVKYLIGKHNALRLDPKVPYGLYRLDRVDSGRIRGLAEDVARDASPKVRQFIEHNIEPYIPHYS